jgi:outer membrane protein OmpA-like peptidoglycan-associated protein
MKFLTTILILIFFRLFLPDYISAQNLVPNGDFERHSTFEFSGGPGQYINFLNDWDPSGTSSWAIYCHKDFVKKFGQQRLKIQDPWVNFDTLNMRRGDGMIKLFYHENCSVPMVDTGCASYIKTKLLSPLELGEVYEISMWVFTKTNLAADPMAYTHMGMFLTRKELFWKTASRINTDYYFANKIFPDQWTQVKWYIRALCSMQYLTIGAFKDDSFPSLKRWIDNPVYYYVDDVTIKKVNEDSLSTDIHPTPYCEYYEKEEKQRTLQSITNLDVNFESNSSTLDQKDEIELDSFYQANLLRDGKIFIIIGHTDSQKAENVALSEARAESVKFYLHQKYNFNELNMLTFGLGSSNPLADNASASGRLQNRRTAIRTSDLTISQIFYRKGLDYVSEDSLQQAYFQFTRWLRMVPMAKRVEMLMDARLNKLKRSKYWKPLVTIVRDSYSAYFDSNNSFFLDSLYFEDQLFRTYSPYQLCGYIPEIDTVVLPELKITEKKALQKDSLNRIAILKYLDQNPYPEISKVGRRQARALSYVILHQGDSILYKKYIPILKARCMEGEAEWDLFAMMTDKLHVVKKEPQEYGTQYTLTDDGGHELYQVDDITQVNIRRKKIGMGPTAEVEK